MGEDRDEDGSVLTHTARSVYLRLSHPSSDLIMKQSRLFGLLHAAIENAEWQCRGKTDVRNLGE